RSEGSAMQSLVRVDQTLTGGYRGASGTALEPKGNVITNEHVIDQAESITVSFANGTTQTARVVGADVADDLAVVRVGSEAIGSGVAPATFGGAATLAPEQFVVALGFTPYFPSPPATRLG